MGRRQKPRLGDRPGAAPEDLAPALKLAVAQVKAGQPALIDDRGRLLFMADGCYECHGRMGQGSFAGARIAPNRRPGDLRNSP